MVTFFAGQGGGEVWGEGESDAITERKRETGCHQGSSENRDAALANRLSPRRPVRRRQRILPHTFELEKPLPRHCIGPWHPVMGHPLHKMEERQQ